MSELASTTTASLDIPAGLIPPAATPSPRPTPTQPVASSPINIHEGEPHRRLRPDIGEDPFPHPYQPQLKPMPVMKPITYHDPEAKPITYHNPEPIPQIPPIQYSDVPLQPLRQPVPTSPIVQPAAEELPSSLYINDDDDLDTPYPIKPETVQSILSLFEIS